MNFINDVIYWIMDRMTEILIILTTLTVFGLAVTGFYVAIKAEETFRKECIAVGGFTVTASDGDIECYKDNREIAELGENSPRNPKLYGDD